MKKHTISLLLSCLLATWATPPLWAQETQTPTGQEEQVEPEAVDSVLPLEDESLSSDLMDLSLGQLLTLDYGRESSPVELHAYLNGALWSFGEQAWGSFANEGSSLAGRPVFVTYSGYIDIRGKISNTVLAEAEFELYKGEKGEFKVCRLRGIWRPWEYLQIALGRDFPPIGVQDKVYYPTSQFRLISNAPYLYWSILRATGWWDAGIHLSGTIPLSFITEESKIRIDISAINGPGEQHHDDENYLVNKMQPNDAGYMFEGFHAKARQPWDNNANKMFPVRLSIIPIKDLEIGASYMFGRYDDEEKYNVSYYFGHALYGGERLTVAAEYGQIDVDVDSGNMQNQLNDDNGTYGDTMVTQRSLYVSAGYKVLLDQWNIHYLEPVARYEFMDSWAQDEKNMGDRHALWAGFRFSIYSGWVVKGAYLYQLETDGPDLENSGFVVESVFEF